ncbi:MAG: hypothetical protein IVW51_11125 [Thermaceae bacterium]|nr:hypothetical protein [Thermaceae bacterium]
MQAKKERTRYLVVFNTSDQLSEFCNHREYVSFEALSKDYDPEAIAALIQSHGSVHFEVARGNTESFVNAVCAAVMSLGEKDADKCIVTVIFEEARNFLKKYKMPERASQLEAEGRKYGIDLIKVDQRLQSQGDDCLDSAAYVNATVVVVFPTSDFNQRQRIMQAFPGIPDPLELRPPVPGKMPGEYAVFDRETGQKALIKRDESGARRCEVIL